MSVGEATTRSHFTVDTLVYDASGSANTSVMLRNLTGGVLYQYVVGAVSAAGEGDRSNFLAASTSPALGPKTKKSVAREGSRF